VSKFEMLLIFLLFFSTLIILSCTWVFYQLCKKYFENEGAPKKNP